MIRLLYQSVSTEHKAASIPLAFDDANNENTFKSGEYHDGGFFGAGFTWGSILLRF